MKKVLICLFIFVASIFTPALVLSENADGTNNLKEKYQSKYSINNECKVLADIDGIAVDSKGNVYISNMTFDRVQVYNNNKFLYSYTIDKSITSSGSLRIAVDKDDNLYLSFVRTNIGFKFYNKQLIEAVDDFHNHPEYPKEDLNNRNKCKDVYGDLYKLQSKLGYDYITETTPDGQTNIVYSMPLSHYLLKLSIGIIIILFMVVIAIFGIKVYRMFRQK